MEVDADQQVISCKTCVYGSQDIRCSSLLPFFLAWLPHLCMAGERLVGQKRDSSE